MRRATDAHPTLRPFGWPEASAALLNSESFERLLALLDSDRSRAGEAYERLRHVLSDFFRWRRCSNLSELADEVIDRVARRLEEGEQIVSLHAFSREVARRVLLEQRRNQAGVTHRVRPDTEPVDPKDNPLQRLERAEAERELQRRITCTKRCLDAEPPETRQLFLKYYAGSGRARIERRRLLASELGLSAAALRIRICRIRDKLATRVNGTLGKTSAD